LKHTRFFMLWKAHILVGGDPKVVGGKKLPTNSNPTLAIFTIFIYLI